MLAFFEGENDSGDGRIIEKPLLLIEGAESYYTKGK